MADVNANIGINIDTSQSLAEIKNLQRQLAQLYTSINKGSAAAAAAQKDLATNLMNSINAGGKFYAQMGSIKTSTESFTHALEKNKLSMREYFRFAGGSTRTFGKLFKSEFDTIGKVAEERVKKMQTQYIKLGRDASGAMKAISVTPTTLDMKNYGNQLAIAAQKQALLNQLLKQGSTNLLNFGKNTQWAGRQLMVGFTIPLAYFGTTAAKTFMELEAQALKFRRVYGSMFTTTAETDKALAEIQSLAEEFTKYGVAVTKTMEMAASAAAMGKTGAELTAQVAEATRLSVLGNVEQQQALDTTISLTNAFGLAAEDLAGKINFLNAVENQTVTAIEDLTIAIPKAGPVVQQLGGSVEDLAFFLTAMREGGINASEGANALKSGLASLINPTEKASAMLAEMGVNIKDIVERNQGNLRQTVVEFAKALDTLAPLERARAVEQLFGKFQFARLSTLFQNVTKDGTQAAKVLQLAGSSVEELAILSERELKAVEDAIGTNFKAAVEQLRLAIAPIGKEFLKVITPVVKFFGNLLDRFNGLEEGTKKVIVVITTLVGLVGPTLLMTFGLIANGAANIIKMFLLMRQGFLKLSGNSTNLAQQTQYLNQEQLDAAIVAASLNQAHSKLTQQFNLEAVAVAQLRDAYISATVAAQRFAAANPGMMLPGARGIKGGSIRGLASGTTGVVGGEKGKDSVPALLMPGEAVIPTTVAQDDKFKPLIEALVTGKIAKFADGTVSVGGKTYSVKSQSAAFNLERKIQELLASGISQDRIIRALDTNIERGRPMTASALVKRLSIGRGSGAGTSAPASIKKLAQQSQSGFVQEKRAIQKILKQKGISLTAAQEKNLFNVQASHIEEVRNAGVKQWNASNLVADLGYVNNYLNTVKGNLGKNLLAMSDAQLKALGIDRNELKALQSGRHPTTASAAQTLRAVASYDASINPRSYQAQAVLAGLEYRSKTGFYAKPLKTLADITKKVTAGIAVGKGETLQTTDGKERVVTGQTGRAKPPAMKLIGGGPSDKRLITGRNISAIFPRGFKGPRLSAVGAEDGLGPSMGIRSGGAPRASQAEGLEKAIKDNTQSQNAGTEEQQKTTKEMKREKRAETSKRISNVSGPVAMAAGTAGMVAAMSGAPKEITNFLLGLSVVSGLLPLMANPWMIAVAGVVALGAIILKFNGDLKKAREAGINLAKAMTMSADDVKELGMLTGKVGASEIADRRRQNFLTMGMTEPQRQFGQNVIQSDFGKKLLGNVETLSKSGMLPKDIAKNISIQLGQAVLQGVIDTKQAASIASALGEQLGSYEIPLNITGNLNKIFGPNGENLADSPLVVALEIKKQSMETQAAAFEQALANRKPLTTAGGTAQMAVGAGLVAAGGAVTASTMGFGAPIGGALALAGSGLMLLSLKDQNKAKSENIKLDTAALQLGIEAVAQNQDLVDSVNRQFDAKVAVAKTDEQIASIEKEREKALKTLNEENAKTVQLLAEQKKQLSPGVFEAAIKASVDALYKEGPMSVFKEEALKALNALKESEFKTELQLGFASGDLDPIALNNILTMISNNKDVEKNIKLMFTEEGFADASLMMQILNTAAQGDQATFDILLNYVNTNKETFDSDLQAIKRIADFKGAYDVTLDMKVNGQAKMFRASQTLSAIEDLPEKIDRTLLQKLAGENPAIFAQAYNNWQALSEGKDQINKNLIVNYNIGSLDPNLQAAAKAANMSVPEFIAKGFVVPSPTTPSDSGGDKDKKGRNTTLDELLKRLKFIRDAAINAEKGVKELLRITSGKGLDKFTGVIQQLVAGPKGGFNREFISFLESMDNATRKTYMTVSKGEVILTKQGKALKEAFNEKVIGEYQVAQVQALQDTRAQAAALYKLRKAGVDSATAVEMVADANLAVAINSKNITGKELRKLASDAKLARDEIKKVNLEVLTLAEDLKKKIGEAKDTLTALGMARTAGITDVEILQQISESQALVNRILQKGVSNETVLQIIAAWKEINRLGEETRGLINPAQAAMDAFNKLYDAASKVFGQREQEAQLKYKKSLQDIASTLIQIPKDFEKAYTGKTIEQALEQANHELDSFRAQINELEYTKIRPIDIQINLAQSQIDDFNAKLSESASKLTLNNNQLLPESAYDDVRKRLERNIQALEIELDMNPEYGRRLVENMQKKISAIEVDLDINPVYGSRAIKKLQDDIATKERDLEVNPSFGTRRIETLQSAIDKLDLEIELQFSRPIADLQEESSDLSNDLTLMDKIADGINKKYDAQAEALNKVSQVNQQILQQQRSQLDLANALSQGDIAAAASAAQAIREQSAAAAAERTTGTIEAARKAELDAVRSASGMTRTQIEDRQFAIAQQIYQLEEQSEIRQRSIRDIQDQIRAIEEVRAQKQIEIRNIQDQIYEKEALRIPQLTAIQSWQDKITAAEEKQQVIMNSITAAKDNLLAGEIAREQFLREKVEPLEKKIKDYQVEKAKIQTEIDKVQNNIAKVQNEILDPLEKEVKKREKILNDTLGAIDAEKLKWEEQQTALEKATTTTKEFATNAEAARKAFEDAKKIYDSFIGSPIPKPQDNAKDYLAARGMGAAGSSSAPGSTSTPPGDFFGPFGPSELNADAKDYLGARGMTTTTYSDMYVQAQREVEAENMVSDLKQKANDFETSILESIYGNNFGQGVITLPDKNDLQNQDEYESLPLFSDKPGLKAQTNELRNMLEKIQSVVAPTVSSLNKINFGTGDRSQWMASGGMVPRYFASGGYNKGTDTVPAMLTPGEFVINRAASKKFGPLLSAINESKFPSMIDSSLFGQPKYNVYSQNGLGMPVNSAQSVSDNSTAVYNYNVDITVGGTNATPDSIAKAVLNEIKYIDSQKIRGQRA